jgi:hypothetical protein
VFVYTIFMSDKKHKKPEKVEGFTLEQMFELVDDVQARAKKGDKSAEEVLSTAWEKWSGKGGYAF